MFLRNIERLYIGIELILHKGLRPVYDVTQRPCLAWLCRLEKKYSEHLLDLCVDTTA